MDQRKCEVHPTLRSAEQCCSSQYFMQYFELQSDRKMADHLSPLARFADPRRYPVQQADQSHLHRGLHLGPRLLSADLGPLAIGRHGFPTAMVGGHCHLPHSYQLPTLPGRAQHARNIFMVAIVHCHRASNVNKLFNMLATSFGDNGQTAYID